MPYFEQLRKAGKIKVVEKDLCRAEYDENGKRCGYAFYRNPKGNITFEGTFLDDKWEGLVIMRNTVSGERKETEFRNDCDKIGKSTNYRYKK